MSGYKKIEVMACCFPTQQQIYEGTVDEGNVEVDEMVLMTPRNDDDEGSTTKEKEAIHFRGGSLVFILLTHNL